MNLDNLLKELKEKGKLREQKSGIEYLNALLDAAHRNFRAASANLGSFEEVAFKAAYDGLLQISRVVLFVNGYRPDDGEQHKTTFMVAGAILGDEFKGLIDKIDKYRIKRNNCIYDPQVMVMKSEAENILNTSREYWHKVREYLRKKDPQLELFEY